MCEVDIKPIWNVKLDLWPSSGDTLRVGGGVEEVLLLNRRIVCRQDMQCI